MMKTHEVIKGISLERQKLLLKQLGNPEDALKIILVAGTSGKGSVTTMLGHMLAKGGFKAGIHISPHLSTPRERLCINGALISKQDFSRIFHIVWEQTCIVHQKFAMGMPSYFEIILAMALLYFKEQQCDYVVLEAGLGGKLDGVNAVKKPILSIITPIEKDHVEILGKTLAAITTDKSQIMRKGKPVIISKQRSSLEKLIMQIASNMGADPIKVHEPTNIQVNSFNNTSFEWHDKSFVLPLTGKHFALNAATALTACSALQIKCKTSNGVFDDLSLPGRSELIPGDPTIILDAAHNPHKTQALVESLLPLKSDSFGLVFTCMADKECTTMLKSLGALKPKKVWITKSLHGPRIVYNMLQMKHAAQKYCSDVEMTYSPQEALSKLRASGLDQILVTGSMYYLGEMRQLLQVGEQD